MAIQVVTPQNFQQLVETGKVDEFKPPAAAKPAEEKTPPAGAAPSKEGQAPSPPRGSDGKFTKAEGSDKTAPASSSTPATGDDDDEKDLPEVVRQKIGKKHRQMKEAEEFAKAAYRKQLEAEQRAEQLQRQLEAKPKSGPNPAPPAEEQEPKPDDFKTVGEYTDALVKFRVKKELASEKAEAARRREEEERAARAQEFGKRMDAAREKYSDFQTVLQAIEGTDLDRVHADVVEYIQESDHGPDLLYHLAKNRDVLDRLRKLSPRRFIAELGKLEVKWEEPPKPSADPSTGQKLSDIAATPAPQPAISRAPAPIAALSSDQSTVVRKDPKDMSFAELRAYERQREAERRNARH